jgi:hypothetical protein
MKMLAAIDTLHLLRRLERRRFGSALKPGVAKGIRDGSAGMRIRRDVQHREVRILVFHRWRD